MKKLIISIALATMAIGAYSAPSVGYQAATNIAQYVTGVASNHLETTKQTNLVSGVNIKTINGGTILGSGDITITGSITNVFTNGVSVVTDGSASIDMNAKQDALPFATNAIPAAVVTDAPWLTAHQSLAPATNYVDTVAAECVKTNGAQKIIGSLEVYGLEPGYEAIYGGVKLKSGGLSAAAEIKGDIYGSVQIEGEDGAWLTLKSSWSEMSYLNRPHINFQTLEYTHELHSHASGDIAVTDDLTNFVDKTVADSTSVFSTNLLALADAATASKLATETMYKMSSGTAYEVGSNTVQYIDLSAADLPIVFTPPTSVSGRASDWVVYCFASADTANAVGFGGFGANHLWANDAAATNAAVKTGITMFMFSQIKSDTFVIGRQELKSVSE